MVRGNYHSSNEYYVLFIILYLRIVPMYALGTVYVICYTNMLTLHCAELMSFHSPVEFLWLHLSPFK